MEWVVWRMEEYSESANGGNDVKCGGGRDRAGSVEKGKWSW